MMVNEPSMVAAVRSHQQELLEEAEHERLVRLARALPSAHGERAFSIRRDLAAACYRFADWLEERESVPATS